MRRGITPVVATVILVAVAVVLAAFMAGFAGDFFGRVSPSSVYNQFNETINSHAYHCTSYYNDSVGCVKDPSLFYHEFGGLRYSTIKSCYVKSNDTIWCP